MFRRYADDGASIADLARWLTSQGAPTRTGKNRWDRSVVWAMLRNPAYAGTVVFGKTMATSGTPWQWCRCYLRAGGLRRLDWPGRFLLRPAARRP